MTSDKAAHGQPGPANHAVLQEASRAYSEHVGAKRHAPGRNGDTSRWYRTTAAASIRLAVMRPA